MSESATQIQYLEPADLAQQWLEAVFNSEIQYRGTGVLLIDPDQDLYLDWTTTNSNGPHTRFRAVSSEDEDDAGE